MQQASIGGTPVVTTNPPCSCCGGNCLELRERSFLLPLPKSNSRMTHKPIALGLGAGITRLNSPAVPNPTPWVDSVRRSPLIRQSLAKTSLMSLNNTLKRSESFHMNTSKSKRSSLTKRCSRNSSVFSPSLDWCPTDQASQGLGLAQLSPYLRSLLLILLADKPT